MRKTIVYYIFLPLLLAGLLLLTFFVITVKYPGGKFHSSYQSLIVDKHHLLTSQKDAKIVLIGGSSLGFGIDESLLSENTGYSVVNMGLHAGFGHLFNTEIVKGHIGPGDIVLLGYEYNWYQGMNKLGVDLVMSGIDNNITLYKHVPVKKLPEVIGYLPKYLITKATYTDASGVYSREAFNNDAHMIYDREFTLYDYNVDYYGEVDLSTVDINKGVVAYLKDFRKYVHENGAQVYLIAPPLYKVAKASDDASFLQFASKAEEETGIPYISNPLDYVFDEEYIFDTIYHCSSKGEIKRTELLIKDLQAVLDN